MVLLVTGIIAQIPGEKKDFITTMMMTIVLRGQRDYTSLLDNTPYFFLNSSNRFSYFFLLFFFPPFI